MLAQKKERDRLGMFLAEGEKCVRDLLPAFNPVSIICSGEWLERNNGVAERYSEKILVSDKRGLEIISSFKSIPDVIGVFAKPVENETSDNLDSGQLYVLLDEIQDPGNLGTIIRTCDWFGIYDIFASKTTVDAYSPKVVQATMGSLARVRVNYCELRELIMKNRSVKVIGTVLNGVPIEDLSSGIKGMILMGNEGRGISEELKDLVDIRLTIPAVNPLSHPDSLNVAVATGIVISHLRSV